MIDPRDEAGASMTDACEAVVERVAMGEPLGELGDHAASCARCRRVSALPTELGATRQDADPGLGFAARMTAGAQHRIVVRRRRRVASGIAGVALVTTLGVFVATHAPERTPLAETTPAAQPPPAVEAPAPDDPWREDAPGPAVDEDVHALAELARDAYRPRRVSASWRRIQKPLEPYRFVVLGVAP